MKLNEKSDGSLSISRKLLFSTGDLSTSLTLAVQTFFQLYFLTDVARLPPATAAWVLGITRLWDAINDPFIGLISDRIKSRFGRRRVLLLFGGTPLGIAFALCWVVPSMGEYALAVYYTIIIIVFDTTFTVLHVGYNSLTPNMTRDYDERSSLNGYRMLYSLGGTLLAIIFATILAEFLDETRRFLVLGIVLGGLAMIPPWIVFFISRDADVTQPTGQMSFWEALRTTSRNKAFVVLAAMFLLSWTATSVLAAMLIYYVNYCLQAPEQSSYFLLVAQGSAVLNLPLIVTLAKRYEKPRAYMIGISTWCLVLIAFFVLPNAAVGLAYVTAFLCGPGIATAAVIPWSMLPDVIEHEEQTSGQRREGNYYAFVSFFQKLGTGFALWSIGLLLSLSGYVTPENASQLADQPTSATQMIRLIIGPGTIVLLLASIPFAWHYPISRNSHEATLNNIENNGNGNRDRLAG